MKQSAGVLLYGPSGCGKTLIASALANESKFNLYQVLPSFVFFFTFYFSSFIIKYLDKIYL